MPHLETAQDVIDDHRNSVDDLRKLMNTPKQNPQEIQELTDECHETIEALKTKLTELQSELETLEARIGINTNSGVETVADEEEQEDLIKAIESLEEELARLEEAGEDKAPFI